MVPFSSRILRGSLLLLCIAFLVAVPVNAFTANSLDLTINKNGDATATFRFTLEGIIENAIPQSLLEDELKKGLTSSSEPPTLIYMDKSRATLLLKNFADMSDVPDGTEYRTSSMNFKKAEIALQSSAVSSVISADFSPSKITITFPDGYSRQFENLDDLPSVAHTVVDPAKAAAAGVSRNTSSLKITSSPAAVMVYMDGTFIGDTSSRFSDIAEGSHTLSFQKEGFTPVTKTVIIKPGENLSMSVVLVYASPTTVPTAPSSPGFGPVLAGLALIICAAVGCLRFNRKKR